MNTDKSTAYEKELSKPMIPDCLSQAMGFLLNRNAYIIKDMVTQALEPMRLSPREVGIMLIIASEGPLTQQELGKKHHTDRTTIVQIVDALEARQFLVRMPNKNDRRSYLLQLTPKGNKILSKAMKIAEREQNKFLAPLAEIERQTMRQILIKLLTYHIDLNV